MDGGVSDAVQATAYLAAACRAAETNRPSPRVRDEYAHLFLPPAGTDAAHRRLLDAGGDEVVVRTALIDELLLATVRDLPSPLLVNLGAGFCSRPYRLALEGCDLIAELDAAAILEAKDRILAGYQASGPVLRIPMDVRDQPALAGWLTQHGAAAKSTVVITEGLLPYLPAAEIAALAMTLAQSLGDAWWLTDIVSTRSAQAMSTMASQSGAAVTVFGLTSLEPFENHGWTCTDYRILQVPQRYGAARGGPSSSRDVVDGVIALRLRSA